MPKRKRSKRLPSGYGSISYLGKGRRNPYCVRPPVSEYDDDGKPIRPKPICYTDTWIHGFAALTAWKAGTYTPGMESNLSDDVEDSSDLAERILSDYMRISKRTDGISFSEAYKEAYAWKSSHRPLSKNTERAYENGYKKCSSIHNLPLASLRQADLQRVIDDCGKSYSSQNQIKTVLSLTYRYALANDIVKTDYSKGVIAVKTEAKHGKAFSQEEMKYIYSHLDDDYYKRILIMCLSGFRISAYRGMDIDLDAKRFKGGVKTIDSKDREVPIHSMILPYVKELIDKNGNLGIYLSCIPLENALRKINPDATPHWTRHTFSALCEKYAVREADRKRMLGHKVGDITNDIYGHRTLEDLRTEIEKIDVKNFVQQK